MSKTTRDSRLAIVLDVDDLNFACLMADAVHPSMGVAKVGLELFATAGPDAVRAMSDRGYEVFADLKFHDIPTQVGRAAAKVGRTGARWLTVHTLGGADMLRAGVEGLAEGSDGAAQVLGVTILTSDADRSRDVLEERVALARDAGCGGVICSAGDIGVVKAVAPELKRVVPGIRLPGSSHHDQASVATPEAAIAAGASILVVGRTVTADVQGLTIHSDHLAKALAEMADRARLVATSISHL
ncbi:orotidine-5'-phosphate decarboxylase [Candidatus Poriferisocius sp.]|uniref:orotidine-5'-phosphate decarboxylase n=1 Tax=Candidatus Poriferisocius sp. TaxID=3101276 RepID=UPI003B515C60